MEKKLNRKAYHECQKNIIYLMSKSNFHNYVTRLELEITKLKILKF